MDDVDETASSLMTGIAVEDAPAPAVTAAAAAAAAAGASLLK